MQGDAKLHHPPEWDFQRPPGIGLKWKKYFSKPGLPYILNMLITVKSIYFCEFDQGYTRYHALWIIVRINKFWNRNIQKRKVFWIRWGKKDYIVLVPARTTFASRMAYLFYFSIPLFPFSGCEESRGVCWKDTVYHRYYTFCPVREKGSTIAT